MNYYSTYVSDPVTVSIPNNSSSSASNNNNNINNTIIIQNQTNSTKSISYSPRYNTNLNTNIFNTSNTSNSNSNIVPISTNSVSSTSLNHHYSPNSTSNLETVHSTTDSINNSTFVTPRGSVATSLSSVASSFSKPNYYSTNSTRNAMNSSLPSMQQSTHNLAMGTTATTGPASMSRTSSEQLHPQQPISQIHSSLHSSVPSYASATPPPAGPPMHHQHHQQQQQQLQPQQLYNSSIGASNLSSNYASYSPYPASSDIYQPVSSTAQQQSFNLQQQQQYMDTVPIVSGNNSAYSSGNIYQQPQQPPLKKQITQSQPSMYGSTLSTSAPIAPSVLPPGPPAFFPQDASLAPFGYGNSSMIPQVHYPPMEPPQGKLLFPNTATSTTGITYVPSNPSYDISEFTEEDILLILDVLPLAEIHKWKYISNKLSKTRSKKLNSEYCIKKFHEMYDLPFDPNDSLLNQNCFTQHSHHQMPFGYKNNKFGKPGKNSEGLIGSSIPYIVCKDGWKNIK
ncbi:hypothetical protein B5S28_g3501 [[Candida] boidinii]|uniref:Unnamed protein product n=1 Tax=Candida boidinii TaxID=5477 RepID=A0ACB5TJ55_CANBO|nr:hypothetical protein B5S28_g3501 [[Candida] boidinii]OWB59158.1 hypothetical protein B5S29_g12 [[Candida] boidinii]OWB70461.1 hypothetical protein B5S31_g139 [[Candida] boidinii]OWB75877.1 hypothetical protein B5S32_g24 [[Candida] boidinii]GME89497.1 unnamed protein product [[Candida] boidinii]